jgi:hypothetical protein
MLKKTLWLFFRALIIGILVNLIIQYYPNKPVPQQEITASRQAPQFIVER